MFLSVSKVEKAFQMQIHKWRFNLTEGREACMHFAKCSKVNCMRFG